MIEVTRLSGRKGWRDSLLAECFLDTFNRKPGGVATKSSPRLRRKSVQELVRQPVRSGIRRPAILHGPSRPAIASALPSLYAGHSRPVNAYPAALACLRGCWPELVKRDVAGVAERSAAL